MAAKKKSEATYTVAIAYVDKYTGEFIAEGTEVTLSDARHKEIVLALPGAFGGEEVTEQPAAEENAADE